jgi:hypothetical protein
VNIFGKYFHCCFNFFPLFERVLNLQPQGEEKLYPRLTKAANVKPEPTVLSNQS